ncbi:hypothetical protein [uncultured Brevibacillus sp.]|uniref:hypothetical protein n=1 Tax=uncultured Brevibacillus sp. TaxID=169970 RepID=UPI00259A5423|nr:hypothetical protein [uncultured Brevibacillus sp.]
MRKKRNISLTTTKEHEAHDEFDFDALDYDSGNSDDIQSDDDFEEADVDEYDSDDEIELRDKSDDEQSSSEDLEFENEDDEYESDEHGLDMQKEDEYENLIVIKKTVRNPKSDPNTNPDVIGKITAERMKDGKSEWIRITIPFTI